MQVTIENMLSVFHNAKLSGSYFVLFLLCLVILYTVDHKKNNGFILYSVGGLILVTLNPVAVYILSAVFPVLQSYTPFILYIPMLLIIPLAVVELSDHIQNEKKRNLLLAFLFILIAVSGNLFGFSNNQKITDRPKQITEEQKMIVEELTSETGITVLADESIAPFFRTQADNITLLYGKDLWTPGMDLGILDGYSEEMMALYEAMKNPADTIDDIMQTAYLYECDIIVVKNFEGYPKKSGHYDMIQETGQYLLYEKDGKRP